MLKSIHYMDSIQIIQSDDGQAWNCYIGGKDQANPYTLYDWQQVVKDSYGLKTYALAAMENLNASATLNLEEKIKHIRGVLPLVHLKSLFFGSQLVSIPYFDHGGILSDNVIVEKKMIEAAVNLGKKLNVKKIELRQVSKLSCLDSKEGNDQYGNTLEGTVPIYVGSDGNESQCTIKWSMQMHKVRMVMKLPGSSDELMKSFKSKLRSQINRPIKEGLTAKIGGIELLNDFYQVFAIRMKDLGSPVHSKALPRAVIQRFPETARVVVVYFAEEPVAASIMLGFKNLMLNPWASALQKFNRMSPNMLLYWTMLSYACDNGYCAFDFGRSTPDEGTFKFKTQWGAEAQHMYWYTISLSGPQNSLASTGGGLKGNKRLVAERIWRRLPLSVTKWIGPIVRKSISL